jgi:uncharacterized protein YigA (DUF484 family)
VGGKGKDRKKKKSSQSGRQAAQRRAIQQRRTEERIRSLRLRLLSAADASATADRLTEAFADRDRVATAYDAEAVLSSATGLNSIWPDAGSPTSSGEPTGLSPKTCGQVTSRSLPSRRCGWRPKD